ncbi:putative disease resistance protein At1g50180 [Apium graveolens]|uniref:putative disease resistance protein At1g50180 n=1 Tax=Apium graveolens TaxID=4045 RepID=UPI003D7AAF01
MAEAVVSFAVKRLGDLLVSEAENLSEVEHQIYEIQHELKRVQCFLKEADKKQDGDERVRRCVTEIRKLAFKVEDVIETFAFEAATAPAGFNGILRKFALMLIELVTSHSVVTEINGIKAELSSLTACLQRDGITRGLEGEENSSLGNWKSERILYSRDVEDDYVGMEKVMENMISVLKRKDKGFEVVSVYGTGGQGKTTIARKLYNHPEFKDYCKVWICITQQFDRERVLQNVLQQLLPRGMERSVTWMDNAKLVQELHKVLTEKNCLIVIDDIPTIDYWRSLEHGFPIGKAASASKILLTTRDVKMAETGYFCKIPILTEEEGWQLLSGKAGINHLPDKRLASGMENAGRNMVNICKGLPLAISVLGGSLEGKSLSEWETICKDISIGEGQTHDDEINAVTQVLALSYDNLPLHLRHCFLCFANYKEDEEIDTEELYMIWMAEGLVSVEDKTPGEMMMDVAERYLAELAHRCLVHVEASKTDGASWSKYRKCRVHDLIRGFCLSKVREEEFLNVFHLQGKFDSESTTSIVRRLCIRSYEHGDESMLKSYDQPVISHIRSLLIWKVPFSTIIRWPEEILSLQKFKLLRVLTASRYKFSNHDIRSITELVYLKYLCLLDCRLEEELPSSIGNLRNLEALDLRVRDPIRIPNVLWMLKQLKHLYLPAVTQFGKVEKLRLDGLNELELLYNYDSRYCEALDVIRLPKLKAFRGDILLEDNLKEQNMINLIKSRELRYCYLNISGGRTRYSEGVASCLVSLLECSFIDALTLNAKICKFPEEYDYTRISGRFTTISLMYCKMEEDPMVLLEKLPNLHILHLYDAYIGAEMVCTATGFPKLKELNLSSLSGLRRWRVDEGALQNLTSIWLYECPELEMLPEGLKHLSALESLYMAGMPSSFKDKVKRKDGTEGEDFYKVCHVHRVTV